MSPLDELLAALRPFALYAESLPAIVPGADRITDAGPALYASVMRRDFVITFTDLRRAKEVFDRLGGKL